MEMDEARTKSAMGQFGFTQEQADQWLSVWATEHHNGETVLSYTDWLKHMVIDAQERLSLAASNLVQALENGQRITAETTTAMQHLSHILSLVAPVFAAERKRLRKEAGA